VRYLHAHGQVVVHSVMLLKFLLRLALLGSIGDHLGAHDLHRAAALLLSQSVSHSLTQSHLPTLSYSLCNSLTQ
jgi:hypothetical protein